MNTHGVHMCPFKMAQRGKTIFLQTGVLVAFTNMRNFVTNIFFTGPVSTSQKTNTIMTKQSTDDGEYIRIRCLRLDNNLFFSK